MHAEFSQLAGRVPFPRDQNARRRLTRSGRPQPGEYHRVLRRAAFAGLSNAGTLAEPEWYAQLSIIGKCGDSERLAHDRSSSHPEYSKQKAAEKLRRVVEKAGPRTCSDIQNTLVFEGCDGCSHNGKITSPIELGKVGVSPGKVFSPEDLDALGIEDPHGFLQAPLNDDGNASRFLAVHGDDVLYAADIGCWLIWGGKRWEEDTRDAVRELAS